MSIGTLGGGVNAKSNIAKLDIEVSVLLYESMDVINYNLY